MTVLLRSISQRVLERAVGMALEVVRAVPFRTAISMLIPCKFSIGTEAVCDPTLKGRLLFARPSILSGTRLVYRPNHVCDLTVDVLGWRDEHSVG